MAQGSFFQFAVAYPVKNHKFRLPTRIDSVLDSVYTAGETVLRVQRTNDGNRMDDLVQKGDRFVVGPNSSGVSENGIIESVIGSTNSSLDLEPSSALSNSFQVGNDFIIYGTRMAGGWDRTTASSQDGRVLPLTIKAFDGGASDNYAQVFRNGSSPEAYKGISQTLDSALLNPFSYYRFGMQYRMDLDDLGGGVTLVWQMNDTSGALPRRVIPAGDVFTWTRFAADPVFVRSLRGTSSLGYTIFFDMGSSDRAIAWVDDVFFEHAKGTTPITRVKQVIFAGGSLWQITVYDDVSNFSVSPGDEVAVSIGSDYAILGVLSAGGSSIAATYISGDTDAIVQDAEIQKKNGGYFELQDHAIQGSINYERIESSKVVSLGDGSVKSFNPISDGDRSERWIFRCRFQVVSQQDFDALMKLLWWQDRGELINFHPFIDDLPHVMTGNLLIRNHSKSTHFSFTKHDFDLQFMEMMI